MFRGGSGRVMRSRGQGGISLTVQNLITKLTLSLVHINKIEYIDTTLIFETNNEHSK